MNSHEVFIHIHQGCFAGTGAIVRLPQCQWSKPDGYGKISQCITTTKHSKAKTVCIFLGIYCMYIILSMCFMSCTCRMLCVIWNCSDAIFCLFVQLHLFLLQLLAEIKMPLHRLSLSVVHCYIDGLVQDCSISVATKVFEILQACTKSLKCNDHNHIPAPRYLF